MPLLATSKNGNSEVERYAALASKRSFANTVRVFGRHMIVGFVSSLMVALGSLQQSSPFISKVNGSWWLGVAQPGSVPSTRFEFPAEVMVIVGLGLGVAVWLDLIRTVRKHPNVPLRAFWYMGAAWVLPLALAGPIFSKDIYSYAALGEMVSHHISPYKYGPNVLGGTSYLTPVDPIWGNTKSPYGPLFVGLSALITTVTFHHAFATMVGLRILALASVIGIAIYVPRLAESFGFDKGIAFTLAILNPLTIYHLIASGHNDSLMLALLLAGLYYARMSRPVLGVILVTLAAMVKVPAEIGVLYIGWGWLGDGRPFRERVRPVITAFMISAIVMELVARITGLGWGWIFGLSTPGVVRSPAVPATALASWMYGLSHLIGLQIKLGSFLTLTRGLGFAISGLGCLYFLYRSRHYGALKSIAYTFLVVTICAPVIYPWYITWGLIMLAVAPSNKITWGIVSVSIAGMVLGLPGGPPLVASLFYLLLIFTVAVLVGTRLKLIPKDKFVPVLNRYFGQIQSV
ncbi:MAG: hypothetical protein EPN30_07500 [Actinomycetota bacterium]|nr:MAG: hypothetical protein EPN30_07500 [Actinomycetota bacterium]